MATQSKQNRREIKKDKGRNEEKLNNMNRDRYVNEYGVKKEGRKASRAKRAQLGKPWASRSGTQQEAGLSERGAQRSGRPRSR